MLDIAATVLGGLASRRGSTTLWSATSSSRPRSAAACSAAPASRPCPIITVDVKPGVDPASGRAPGCDRDHRQVRRRGTDRRRGSARRDAQRLRHDSRARAGRRLRRQGGDPGRGHALRERSGFLPQAPRLSTPMPHPPRSSRPLSAGSTTADHRLWRRAGRTRRRPSDGRGRSRRPPVRAPPPHGGRRTRPFEACPGWARVADIDFPDDRACHACRTASRSRSPVGRGSGDRRHGVVRRRQRGRSARQARHPVPDASTCSTKAPRRRTGPQIVEEHRASRRLHRRGCEEWTAPGCSCRL